MESADRVGAPDPGTRYRYSILLHFSNVPGQVSSGRDATAETPLTSEVTVKKGPLLLAICGSIILLVTAAFHATGYASITRQVESAAAGEFLKQAVPTLWLFFSWHLLAIAAGVLAAIFTMRTAARPVLLACGFVVAVDFLWVWSIAGFFAGTLLLLAAAACLVAAAFRVPRLSS